MPSPKVTSGGRTQDVIFCLFVVFVCFVLLVLLAFAFLKFLGQDCFVFCCCFVVVFVLNFFASMLRCALIRAQVDAKQQLSRPLLYELEKRLHPQTWVWKEGFAPRPWVSIQWYTLCAISPIFYANRYPKRYSRPNSKPMRSRWLGNQTKTLHRYRGLPTPRHVC